MFHTSWDEKVDNSVKLKGLELGLAVKSRIRADGEDQYAHDEGRMVVLEGVKNRLVVLSRVDSSLASGSLF